MVGQFHRSSFASNPPRAHAQAGSLKLLFVPFVHAVIAVILLRTIRASANGMQNCAPKNLQALVTGALGAAIAAVRQSTGQGSNDMV